MDIKNKLPIITEFWISKVVVYVENNEYKAADAYKKYREFCEKLQQKFEYFDIPSKDIFYAMLKKAMKKGTIGGDLCEGLEEIILKEYNSNEKTKTKNSLVKRKSDGIYFQNIFLDTRRLSKNEFPKLINKSYEPLLQKKFDLVGVENIININ